MFKFKDSNINLEGFTFLMPSVSVGNVPQLTIDLIISSLDFKKAAIVWHPAIVACVGGDPYGEDSSEVCTACELYVNHTLKLAVLQLRSSIEQELALKFFNEFCQEIVKFNFKKVLILMSAFDYELHNIEKSKYFYISNCEGSESMSKADINKLESNSDGKYYVNGGGFGVKLYEVLKQQTKCTVFIKFVSEGDNRPDAVNLLEKLSIIEHNLLCQKYIFPSSWKYVFGGPPPIELY